MKTAARLFPALPPAALVAACLIAARGLPRESLPATGHDEDHAGHVIPAHKPKTFPDAVRRLRELNDSDRPRRGRRATRLVDRREDLECRAGHRQLAPRDRRRQRHARAALERSERPVRDARRGLPGDPSPARRSTDAHSRVDDAARAISDLESLLAAADPRWFAGDAKAGAATSTEARPC